MLRAGAFATALSRAKLSWEPIARAWPLWCMGFQSSCGAGSQPAPLLCAWHSPAPVFTHQNNPSPDSDLPPPRQFPALVFLLSGITRGGWGSRRRSMPADHTWTCQMLLSSLEESQAASLISHNRLALAQNAWLRHAWPSAHLVPAAPTCIREHLVRGSSCVHVSRPTRSPVSLYIAICGPRKHRPWEGIASLRAKRVKAQFALPPALPLCCE